MTKKGVILAVVTAVTLLIVVVSSTFWLLRQTLPGAEDLEHKSAFEEPSVPLTEESTESGSEIENETAGSIRVTLFYLSSTGRMLSPEEREIPFAKSLQEQANNCL